MEVLWKALAWVVSRKPIADWLIYRSWATPYFDLSGYMERWWLFNAYAGQEELDESKRHDRKYKWLPSIRIHHILRADLARDLHDHPWDARTIILKGWYIEDRLEQFYHNNPEWPDIDIIKYTKVRGDTATLKYGEYHTITKVSPGGVWTLFMTWDYKGMWGFLVNGVKIPWREYTDGGAA